jgi:hypothetical protein
MDRLLDLSKNSLQYANSMCPSMIRKLKVIVYFRKVFLLSKFKYFCFVTILDMSLIFDTLNQAELNEIKINENN